MAVGSSSPRRRGGASASPAAATPQPEQQRQRPRRKTEEDGVADDDRGALPAAAYIATFVGAILVAGVRSRAVAVRGRASESLLDDVVLGAHPLHTFVVLFSAVNVLICVWELALWFHIDRVKQLYAHFARVTPRGRLPSPFFVAERVKLADALSLRHWAVVWSTYSLLDESYTVTGSFGHCIDSGNGVTTLLPSLAMALASADPLGVLGLSPRTFGFVSALALWQGLYGTLLYALQYVENRRWEKHGTSLANIVLFVVGTNIFWVVGPAFGLYACYDMVATDSTRVFGVA